ncbi:hypothetical protein PbJCM13498_31710 [Prolixibacter bellariivorans]|uniref:SnoaL-like domain-containing protein n=1 Tax=Prolixibacter bellariivorans TaxID=314319 RepID=A0A5M4B305_9BACT|nr:nuclear transport factor 2 family protein [Prolixibacter bellariivorans]GET34308.1 hypothetical protein PbJCM13498_31710 [Prolixibacter bellariivorans]
MKKTVVIFILAILGFNFQAHSQPLSPDLITSIEYEIDATFQKMVALAEKLDYNALNQGVDDYHKAGFLVNGNYYADYATLISAVKLSAQGVSKQKLVLKDKKITVLNEQVALLTASGTSQVNLYDGREFTGDFYWSFVYEKINGEWKVIQSHQSRGR